MQNRTEAIQQWIETRFHQQPYRMEMLAGDASFRRYFRLFIDEQSFVIMDAPPDREPLAPFIKIAKLLNQSGIKVPAILDVNESQGFMLLEDLGDTLLLDVLSQENADRYYALALKTLIDLQNCPVDQAQLPHFDKQYMQAECDLFETWFLNAYLSLDLSRDEKAMIDETIHSIINEISEQPQLLIHRDYHSRNLLLVEGDIALIDFQDAMLGPLCYDVVSLLKDCYIAWPRAQVLQWLRDYHQQSPFAAAYSFESLLRAFDFCGLQRHLKVCGIFSRLYLRDKKSGYLKDLPLTLHYLQSTAADYPELQSFHQFLSQRIQDL